MPRIPEFEWGVTNVVEQDVEGSADRRRVVDGSNQFGLDLYSTLAYADGNVFLSPSSVLFAFAMAYAGAAGETATEIAEVLHFGLPARRLHEAIRQLQQDIKTEGVELRIANRLWGQQGYPILDSFLRDTEEFYGAAMGRADFKYAGEDARIQINQWVDQQTAGKIKDIIAPKSLDETIRLVIANAVYFLGSWAREFDVSRTREADFSVSPDRIETVKMMRNVDTFRYGEFEDLQVVELPYRSGRFEVRPGSEFALTVLLPRRVDGLADIEAKLSQTTLQQWSKLRPCLVDVQIPRLGIESEYRLEEQLRSLGIELAFSKGRADFSAITDDPEGLFIGAVIHKAFVDINEKGTEAAAATITMALAGAAVVQPEVPASFCADHPFLFLIQDRETRMIHFIGRVCCPMHST